VVVQCFPLPQSLSSVRLVCVREHGVAYERPAGTSDVPYEGAVRWHLQPVLRISLVTPIIVHGRVHGEVISTNFNAPTLLH